MQSPKTIVIKNEHLILGLLAFIILSALGFAFLPTLIAQAREPKPAEMAARLGAQAFLSVDVEKGRDAWENAVCENATEKACTVVSGNFGQMIWAGVESNATRQSCQATEADKSSENEQGQVWKVSLDCRNLVSGETTTPVLQVVVTEVGEGWLLDQVLFSEVNDAE
jgi:hypothetical protein